MDRMRRRAQSVLLAMMAATILQPSVTMADTIDDLIVLLQSGQRGARRTAFYDAVRVIRSDVDRSRIAPALIRLLEVEGDAVAEVEGDADYLFDVIHAVSLLKHDAAIPVLVRHVGTGTLVPRSLAAFGPRALAPVLARQDDGDWVVRKCVMLTLLEMLSPQNISQFSQEELRSLADALQRGTTDPSPYVTSVAGVALQQLGVPRQQRIAGSGYNVPEGAIYRASFSFDVSGPNSPIGSQQYYYTRTRMNFVSTTISNVTYTGNTFTIEGVGMVNGAAGYTFTATAVDGSPDTFGIVIRRPGGTTYYSASPAPLASGSLTISTP